MINTLGNERFWSCVDIGEEHECWNWKAGKTTQGYGMYSSGRKWLRYAHRYAYELHTGKSTANKKICHSCSNPACCNPGHLFEGVPMKLKRPPVRYQRNVLTEKQVLRIHRLHRNGCLNQPELAQLFGVHVTTINHILKGRIWKHVDVPDDEDDD